MTNVVLILLDDLGAECFSVLGRGGTGTYGYPALPWLTALVTGGTVQGVTYAGGVLCRRAYAEQLCSPTRATLLTGRHPFRHGVGDIIRDDHDGVSSQAPLPESEYTLAKLLKDNGYETGIFGKFHLGNTNNGGRMSPNRAGFDIACTILFNTDGTETHTVSGTSFRDGYYAMGETIQGKAQVGRTYYATSCISRALRWVRDVNSRGNPFFCYLPLYNAHASFVNRVDTDPDTLNTPPTTLYDALTWTAAADLPNGSPSMTQTMHMYRASIEAADKELGRFCAGLPAGVLDDTLIVFATDNGSSSTTLANEEHPTLGLYDGAHGKDTPYEPGICVPLVFAGAGVVSPNRAYDQLVSIADVYPTVAAMLGVDIPEERGGNFTATELVLDGVSLEAMLDNSAPTTAVRTYAYSEWFQPNGVHPTTSNPDNGRTAGEWAIQDGTYKLLKNGLTGTLELYVVGPTASYNPMEATNLTPLGSTAGLTAPQLAAYTALLAARNALLLTGATS